MGRVKFSAPPIEAGSERFRSVLQRRVDAYFDENQLSKAGDWRMAVKAVFYLGGYIGIYLASLGHFFTLTSYVLAMAAMGLFMAGIGFNIAHDAAHGGLSRRPFVNRLAAHSFTLVGAHLYTWKILHNVIHHSYTNIPGLDGDLNTVPALRYHDNAAPVRAHHGFQHIYAFAMYALASLVWMFQKDYVHMRKREHCGYKKPIPPRIEWVILAGCKLGHYGAFLVVPVALAGRPLHQVILGFLTMHVVAGLSLACVFSVGHLVDDVQIVSSQNGVIRDEWASHQVRTTANFASTSRFWAWTVGGLNTQIEHHLFPSICHVHYRALAPIVRQTALEFNLPYVDYPTLTQALWGHVRHLKRYGRSAPQLAFAGTPKPLAKPG